MRYVFLVALFLYFRGSTGSLGSEGSTGKVRREAPNDKIAAKPPPSLLTPNFEKLYSVLMNDMMIKEMRPWPRTEPNSSARTAGQRL